MSQGLSNQDQRTASAPKTAKKARRLRTLFWASILLLSARLVIGYLVLSPDATAEAGRSQQETGASRMAEEAKKPKVVRVTARSLSAAPGAIVCPDYSNVEMVFHLYSASWEDAMQDTLTRGQSKVLRGDGVEKPNPEEYGCHLIPPGTPMLREPGYIVPVVMVQLADGSVITGATLNDMLSMPVPKVDPAIRAAALAAAENASTQAYATPSAWSPSSRTADAITGGVSFSTTELSIAGHDYAMNLVRPLTTEEFREASQFFSYDFVFKEDGFLFQVKIPASAPMLQGNSLCGSEDVNWVYAMATTSGTKQNLYLAFFSGSSAPSLSSSTSAQLCGIYSYVR